MSDLYPCEHCEKPIARNALHCPYCGGIPKRRNALQVWATVLGLLIAMGLAAYLAFLATREPSRPPAARAPARPVVAEPPPRLPEAKPDR